MSLRDIDYIYGLKLDKSEFTVAVWECIPEGGGGTCLLRGQAKPPISRRKAA